MILYRNRLTFHRGKPLKEEYRVGSPFEQVFIFLLLDGKRVEKTYIIEVTSGEQLLSYHVCLHGKWLPIPGKSIHNLAKVKQQLVRAFNEAMNGY